MLEPGYEHANLVVVERVNERDEPPGLGPHGDGYARDVLNKHPLEMGGDLEIVRCAQGLRREKEWAEYGCM